MWLIQGPKQVAKKFKDKFSEKVEKAVREHFAPIFSPNLAEQAGYERWVVTCGASARVKEALREAVPGVDVYMFDGFVEQVLQSIRKWKRKPTSALPSDKWLLCQIDQLNHSRLLIAPQRDRQKH